MAALSVVSGWWLKELINKPLTVNEPTIDTASSVLRSCLTTSTAAPETTALDSPRISPGASEKPCKPCGGSTTTTTPTKANSNPNQNRADGRAPRATAN